MRRTRTEVLVVGAGPIGLWSALLLAESGIEVTLIDREMRTAARSYACALHPATLRLLDKLGLAESIIERGRRVETVAFYDGENRQAELKLSKQKTEFPFLLILPQSTLEGLLQQRLRSSGVPVLWNHRFEGMAQDDQGVTVEIEELEGTSTGYITPHWETVVKNRTTLQADYLIGADGHNSMVRPRAQLEYQKLGNPETFVAFEFETDQAAPAELRVVLQDTNTSVLWPLAENRCRWTFQISRADLEGDFPEKERRAVRLAEPAIDERIRQYIQKVAQERAPWFTNQIKTVDWCTEVSFEKGLACKFGKDHCWLAGDSAHQTGPAGVQSMNAGFTEVMSLAGVLKRVLREAASPDLLQTYDRDCQKEWRTLLALDGGLQPCSQTNPWVAKRSARILPCLPGYGADLTDLAGQLKLSPVSSPILA